MCVYVCVRAHVAAQWQQGTVFRTQFEPTSNGFLEISGKRESFGVQSQPDSSTESVPTVGMVKLEMDVQLQEQTHFDFLTQKLHRFGTENTRKTSKGDIFEFEKKIRSISVLSGRSTA